MTAPRFFLGQERTTASSVTPRSSRSSHPVRLTARGEFVYAFAIFLGVFVAMWGAAALGFWITGVEG